MTYVKLDAFGRRSWSGKGFYPQLWNSHVLYFCRISPDFSTLKKNKKQTSCPCGSTTKHTSKRNSTYTLRVLQMQQGRYQYSKSQYPFVVYLFWYSVLQRATLYKMHHEQTARTYLLLMLFWLQRSWCKPVGWILAPRKKEAFKCGYILVGPQLSRVSLLSRLKKTNRGVEEICLQVWLWRRRLVCLWQTAFWAGATLKEHPAFVVWWYALMWLCMYVCVCACVRTCECWILLSHLLLRLSSCFGSKSVPGDNSA